MLVDALEAASKSDAPKSSPSSSSPGAAASMIPAGGLTECESDFTDLGEAPPGDLDLGEVVAMVAVVSRTDLLDEERCGLREWATISKVGP